MIAIVAAAHAYSVTGAFWTWQDHPIEDAFEISTSSFPSSAGTSAEVRGAVEGAMTQWDALGLDMSLSPGGEAAGANVEAEGVFVVGHGSYSGSLGGALAFAGTWTYEDGAAFDCDVFFLDENDYGAVAWDATGSDGGYDIESTALHELGHCLGLDHSASTSAIMYAYYNGGLALTADDIDGVESLYDADACVDGDGDGYTDCEADCDDDNALVHPGSGEVCDGDDDDCDGVVDATATVTIPIGSRTNRANYDWIGGANVVYTREATRLVSVRQRFEPAAGTRLVWYVYVADDAGGPFSLVRTELSYATASGWEESPVLDLPLQADHVYAIGLGTMVEGVRTWYDDAPDLTPVGPLTPMGMVYGRALGDDGDEIDTAYLWEQELIVVDQADPDGDGATAECGDPCPLDALDDRDGDDACDSDDPCPDDPDDDLDGDGVCAPDDPCPADELDDRDGDGACDSDDTCPEDATGDGDGDGACDSVDPCPEDATDDSDGDGACDGVDTCPDDAGDTCHDAPKADEPEPEGCGCGGAGAPGLALLLAGLALATARRSSPSG